MIELLSKHLELIEKKKLLSTKEIEQARYWFGEYNQVILAEGANLIEIEVQNNEDIHVIAFYKTGQGEEDEIIIKKDNSVSDWSVWTLLALYVAILRNTHTSLDIEGKKYTREGMRKRVWKERKERAEKEKYRIDFSKNLYGEHIVKNEKGNTYKVTLHNFEKKTGYIDNIDWQTNKLGTTKHILHIYKFLEENPSVKRKLKDQFPFIDIFPDPKNDYQITWFFPDKLNDLEQNLINQYFGTKKHFPKHKLGEFFSFVKRANELERFKIREDVYNQIEAHFNEYELQQLKANTTLDFSSVKAELYPYQKEGVEFAVFKKGVLIADEMGLGKTLQAIATGILKKDIFNFKKTLVICPASVKHQWKKEIEKFTNENVTVIEGMPEDRRYKYVNDSSYFHIINYETVLRDLSSINKSRYDFVILDEAQKIKNYETKISASVKKIHKKHGLVITGTPLENKLIDLYSIVNFLDTKLLSPQWEFSYQHCIFHPEQKNRILGYYNLQTLKKRLQPILIRRQKHEVFKQLPNVIEKNVYLTLTEDQEAMHAGFMRGIARILGKKFKTAYDMQRLMLLLTSARRVCNSTFLIDKQSHHSSKLEELKEILLNKLDLKNNNRKIIIFSEWVTMLELISEMLKQNNLKYAMLTGKVPVPKRKSLIENFENDPDCQIFLSSESGGSGLNLQVADTVINFELPWNPAKKNQRIGRIDRIGQKKNKLLVYNLICNNSIEISISAGLGLKQNMFDGVLNTNNLTDTVDFTEKGKSQFIQKLENAVAELSQESETNFDEEETSESQEEFLTTETPEYSDNLQSSAEIIDDNPPLTKETSKIDSEKTEQTNEDKFAEMEQVMNKGIDFLSGIYKMSTGKQMTQKGKPNVTVNKETGEVHISFKLA